MFPPLPAPSPWTLTLHGSVGVGPVGKDHIHILQLHSLERPSQTWGKQRERAMKRETERKGEQGPKTEKEARRRLGCDGLEGNARYRKG